MIDVRPISADQTYPLRSLVLRPGQPLEACRWQGDDDPQALHLGAFEGESLVAITTMIPAAMSSPRPLDVPADLDVAKALRLRGMATHPDYRRQGLGAALLSHCIEQARGSDSDLLWCNARTSATDFYRRHGFATIGEEFEIEDIGPHVVMWLDVGDHY